MSMGICITNPFARKTSPYAGRDAFTTSKTNSITKKSSPFSQGTSLIGSFNRCYGYLLQESGFKLKLGNKGYLLLR